MLMGPLVVTGTEGAGVAEVDGGATDPDGVTPEADGFTSPGAGLSDAEPLAAGIAIGGGDPHALASGAPLVVTVPAEVADPVAETKFATTPVSVTT